MVTEGDREEYFMALLHSVRTKQFQRFIKTAACSIRRFRANEEETRKEKIDRFLSWSLQRYTPGMSTMRFFSSHPTPHEEVIGVASHYGCIIYNSAERETMVVQANRYLLLLVAAAVLTAGKGDDSQRRGVYIAETSTDHVMGSFAGKNYQSWPAKDKSSNKNKMKKHSGKGTIIYDNGDMFEGKFENNEPHGVGKMTYKDGRVCEGIWKNGKIEYEGELFNGEPHGRGKMIYSTGYVYEGDWKNGLWHGQGTFKRSDDYVYEGEWKDGLMNGKGTYRWKDGSSYEGEWSLSLMLQCLRDSLGILTMHVL